MQSGHSHVKCGCNVDPPHLHILNVDVMWSNLDVLWSNVDFHILNVIKVVRDPCQKITLLLLKSKSVRVIVPESCF